MEDRFRFRLWLAPGSNSQMVYSKDASDSKLWSDHRSWMGYTKVLMQCTGLRDKNNQLIYEGDLLKVDLKPENPGKYYSLEKVVWSSPEFTVETKLWMGAETFVDLSYSAGWGEVIGNIYENPELLQKAAKTEAK